MKLLNGTGVYRIVIRWLLLAFSCKKSTDDTSTGGTATVPTVFSSNYKSAVTLSATTTTVTLKSNGTPDHVTPYWGTLAILYMKHHFAGQNLNPGVIGTQNYSMTIPINPSGGQQQRSYFVRTNRYGVEWCTHLQ